MQTYSSSSNREKSPQNGFETVSGSSTGQKKESLYLPKEDKKLVRYLTRDGAYDERDFAEEGIIPLDGSSRYRITRKCIEYCAEQGNFDVLDWMAGHGAVTGCYGLGDNKEHQEKFFSWLENAPVTSLNMSENNLGRTETEGMDLGGDSGYRPGVSIRYDISSFARVLVRNANLVSLMLRETQLADPHLVTLASGLLKNTSLTSLDIGNNPEIGLKGIEALMSIFKTNKTLTHLGLDHIGIKYEMMVFIAAAIKENNTPCSLDFSFNKIDSESAKKLFDALITNSKLQHLDLGHNRIITKNAEVLAKMLEKNNTLTLLDLAGSKIGPVGIAAMSNALKKNTTLATLSLASCKIHKTSAIYLIEALTENKTLTSLDLTGTDVSTEDIDTVNRLLERNKQNVTQAIIRERTKD